MKRKPKLYTPPDGFYDLPFTWVYDASQLTNGVAYPNQYVYLQGGYGDFILRRVVGLSRILVNPAGAVPSTYQIQDNGGSYIESDPVLAATADDLAIVPELRYQETGAIKFDLGEFFAGAGTQANPTSTAMVAFQGVRRMRGNPPRNPTYRATPKTFTWIMPPAAVLSPVGTMVRISLALDNYDFELYDIILVWRAGGSFAYVAEVGGTLFSALNNAGVTLNIPTPGGGQVYSSVVVGTTVTLNLATTPSQMTAWQLVQAVNNDPNLINLLGAAIAPGTNSAVPAYVPPALVGQFLSPPAYGGANGSANLVLYDSNKIAVSNLPVLDEFMDDNPNGAYKNGAVVTPLWYPKDSVVQMDVYSNLTAGSGFLQVYLVGKKWFPC